VLTDLIADWQFMWIDGSFVRTGRCDRAQAVALIRLLVQQVNLRLVSMLYDLVFIIRLLIM
jgi:hypothetical protein